ncbi:MAG: hypothetical protein ABI972_04700 [Acidobacteriota bacterium]
MTRLRAITSVALLFIFASCSVAQIDPRKANKAEAKRFVQLAQAAEKQGNLAEARSYFLQAEGKAVDKAAEDGLKRVNELVAARVKQLSGDAGRAYQSQDFAKTTELLESALALQPGNSTTAYNLALTRYRRGEHSAAIIQLERYSASLQTGVQRMQADQLRSAMMMGVPFVPIPEQS